VCSCSCTGRECCWFCIDCSFSGLKQSRLQSAQFFPRSRETFQTYSYRETSRNTNISPSRVAWTQVFKWVSKERRDVWKVQINGTKRWSAEETHYATLTSSRVYVVCQRLPHEILFSRFLIYFIDQNVFEKLMYTKLFNKFYFRDSWFTLSTEMFLRSWCALSYSTNFIFVILDLLYRPECFLRSWCALSYSTNFIFAILALLHRSECFWEAEVH
jgi:hypothetical protein